MNKKDSNIIIISCPKCGARFKIRNPQPGAKFKCNRCKSSICIPGKKDESINNKEEKKVEILKIELHKSSFSDDEEVTQKACLCTTRVKKEELNLHTTSFSTDILKEESNDTKRIFASDKQNRQRLLYLISLYTKPAKTGEKGTWIRKVPLQVFMYEGVINEVFDWDYAPASVYTSEGRTFINISQEGEEDLFFLLSHGYVYNLKLTTTQHRNITAYQISPKGVEYVKKIPDVEKKIVNHLISCEKCKNKLYVSKRDENFYLICENCGYSKKSTITKAEDVSYFCIPYFPETLTHFKYTPSLEIKKRLETYFKANPRDNIQDTLEELIYLSRAKVVISEWIPFGSNQMTALNYKLGSNERIQNAKFTQEIDTSPDSTILEIPESLTLVKVRDYSLATYVDFEAFIYLPEDPQIVQIEEFGVHIESTGFVRYGLEILAINERDQDKVSLDHLPRVLVDILQDSTTIMDTLLTNYQKNLLEIIFQGKAKFRDKYFFIIARDIHCFDKKDDVESVSEELIEILSQENYQDELNQVTEEVKETALFPDGTVVILGSHGSILVTRTPEKYEQLVSDFLFTMDIEIFLNNFFIRLFLMNDELKDIQNLIKRCETDPTAISTVQHLLSKTSGDTILMEEIRNYLEEAIEIFLKRIEKRYKEYSEDMSEVLKTFRIKEMAEGLAIRIKDMKKVIQGTQETLEGLTRITDVISERQMRRIQEALSNNTRSLEDITKTNERSGMSLRILEIIMSGSLAFNIMDQITGEWSITQKNPLYPILRKIFDIPGMWLAFSISLWALFAAGIFIFMRWLEEINAKAIAARLKLDIPCDIEALKRYLQSKNLVTHDADIFPISNYIKVCWEEEDKKKWLGNKPRMELVYDEKNGFLLSALIEVNRPTRGTTIEKLNNIFLDELRKAKVIL